MALKTLQKIKEIGGFRIVDRTCDDMCRDEAGNFDWEQFDELRKQYPIHITHDKNMISFKIQNGPIKENGINGCQIDTLIETAKVILEGLNKQVECNYNYTAISHLRKALFQLELRKKDREKRQVEGTNKK